MTVRRLVAIVLVACEAAAVAACASGDAPVPMRLLERPAACARPVDTLLVLLPGALDRANDFDREGFVDLVRMRGIAADIALVDATIPYYANRTIVDRLDADVLAPARARGIRHVWVGGISLGGLGTLIVSNERRGAFAGLFAIAPYVGQRTIVAEVEASGGVARWAPPGAIPPDDTDRRLWQWIRELTAESGRDAAHPPLWLGYGVDDRLAAGHRLVAAALPAARVFTASGGHDWPAWRAVWGAMLDAAPLPRDPSCAIAVSPPSRP